MKNILKLLVVSLLLSSVVPNTVLAQKINKKTAKADRAFDAEEYFKASELYKKAYKKTKNRALKAEITFKQAECYRLSGNTKRAESYYKRAVKSKYPDLIVYLRYADMLMINAKYEDALEQYDLYNKKNPTDIRGEKGMKSCQFAVQWMKNPTRYLIQQMPVVNSRSNDFSPAFGNRDYSEVYFISSRKGSSNDKIDERTGEFFTDIYKTKLDKKGKWSIPKAELEPINTEAHEGTLCLNENGTTMYFTTCKVEIKKSLGCGISISQRKGKLWGSLNTLQIKLDSNSTIGHPAVSSDEKKIIFSANLSGGYGGKDLWIVEKINRGQWADPVNLGPAVNTSGDEMFPFLHQDGTLYFSSNGHVGMGGLDIYKSILSEDGLYVSSVNLKYPVNSSADDFGMIIERKSERGYFTSNRVKWTDSEGNERNSKGGDDIYQFELPPLILTLQGVITDTKTGAVVTNSKVKLVGDDGSAVEFITDNTGSYNFELTPLTSYEIIVTKEGYLNNKVTETTVGIEGNTDLVKDINIDPIKKEIILPRIEYDFAKSDLRPQSILDLDLLIITLNENPNITIELNSHTDFRGTDKQNNALSQKRADACIEYLISKGIPADRLLANGKGESTPYVMDQKDGKLKVGDVLSVSYINKFRFKKNKEKAHQYNRRTTFKVLTEDYVPTKVEEEVTKEK
ncbi:MAG: OmpA family protein [Flavobacteriales bacterium]|nr:OmpA family protein [Flavobacteriales bacterium]